MTKEEIYSQLLDRLTGVCYHDTDLNTLKEHFKTDISSDRRYDRIQNLTHLIRILEKRDVISCNNIIPLCYIADVLQNYDIIELICHFNTPTQAEPIQNVAAQVQPIRQNIVMPSNIGRVLPTTDRDPIRKVYDHICREIGQKWKEFARALKISEGSIDQLESRHRSNIPEMAREVIVYHRENCDPRYWQYELLNALVDARRRDLSIQVQNIFAMHASN